MLYVNKSVKGLERFFLQTKNNSWTFDNITDKLFHKPINNTKVINMKGCIIFLFQIFWQNFIFNPNIWNIECIRCKKQTWKSFGESSLFVFILCGIFGTKKNRLVFYKPCIYAFKIFINTCINWFINCWSCFWLFLAYRSRINRSTKQKPEG